MYFKTRQSPEIEQKCPISLNSDINNGYRFELPHDEYGVWTGSSI